MKGLEFPITGTKVEGLTTKFDLNSPEGREKYFQTKVPDEIEHIKNYLQERTFIAYMLGKKGSGKGTYSKLFTEAVGADKVATVSVGDLIREIDDWENFKKTLRYERMKKYYRGFISFDEAIAAHLSRSTEKLLPTEFILALLKAHIDDLKGKAIFVDGLPRDLDQVSYSLYFRDLINYRDDPDLFVMIDIPESVIDARIKTRVVCPICHTSRNQKLLVTSKIEYDKDKKEFFLICDNPDCPGNGKERMLRKEGDEKGIDPIRTRLNKDEEILKKAFSLHGIPKVLLRNHVPVAESDTYFDPYEITPEYVLKYNEKENKVEVEEKPWTVKDDNGVESYSLLAYPVALTMIKQIAEVLEFEV